MEGQDEGPRVRSPSTPPVDQGPIPSPAPGDRLGRVELPRPRRSRRCDSDANRCRARVRRRRCDHAPSGYPHRRWNCLRRCSGPPTSAWRDGSASSWRCPLAPSGSTGAPAGADPPDPPPPARCRPQSPGRCARSDGRSRSRPLSLVVHLGSETAVTDWALDGSVHAKQQSRPTVLLVVPSARLNDGHEALACGNIPTAGLGVSNEGPRLSQPVDGRAGGRERRDRGTPRGLWAPSCPPALHRARSRPATARCRRGAGRDPCLRTRASARRRSDDHRGSGRALREGRS
jgi:hypothetical protein